MGWIQDFGKQIDKWNQQIQKGAGNVGLGAKTIVGQGPKPYVQEPTVVYSPQKGQPYGGYYNPSKDLINIVRQPSLGKNEPSHQRDVLLHEMTHRNYQPTLNANYAITSDPKFGRPFLGPNDTRAGYQVRSDFAHYQPDFYKDVNNILESPLYSNGANYANEMLAYFSPVAKHYKDTFLPQKINNNFFTNNPPALENYKISPEIMKYY